MKLFFLSVFVMIAQLGLAQDKYQWQTVTSAGYTYKTVPADPMKSRFYVLKNGLSVILTVNKKEPRIAALIPVRAGSKTDPADHTGLAHYLEHMMFKGTDKYGSLDWSKEKPLLDSINALYEQYNHSTDTAARAAIYRNIDKVSGEAAKFAIANEYDKMMASMGGQNTNAFTSVEETVYTEDIPSTSIDKFLTLQAERFRSPVFRIFHTELEAVYEEKNRSLDNDASKVEQSMYASLFPTHNYGQQTTIGTVEHLKNPSLKEIRKYYNANYVPNNMAIILAGDFDPDHVIKKIDELFSYMQPKPVTEYNPAPEKPIAAPVIKEVFGPDAESTGIGFRLPGDIDTKSTLIAETLMKILYNGKAGLLDLNLNKKQTVLNASGYLDDMKDYSVLYITARNKSDQTLEQVKDLLLDQINQIKQGNFDEALIRATVDNARFSFLDGLNNNGNRTYRLLNPFVVSKNETWPADVRSLDDMNKLTKKDIIDFANKWLGNNYVCIYKRKGEDKSIVKVNKPPITPVEVNRDAQSEFLKKIDEMPATPVSPQWLDYTKDFQKKQFGNTELLYVQNKDNEIFRLRYRLEMGTYNSKLLSISSQYLQFLGTDEMSAEDVSKQFYDLACNFSIDASAEYTTINLTGLQKNMEKAAGLFEDILTHCKADEKALASLKARILKARANNKLNKRAILSGLRFYAMYGEKNPFNNQLSNDELNALKAADLVDFLHGLLQYKHVVIYYGPLSLPDATTSIHKVHMLPTTFVPYPKGNEFAKIQQTQNTVLFTNYDMVQAEISWVRNTSDYDPSNETLVEVFNEYYGGGMGSVVFQTLRESKALAYGTFAFYQEPSKKEDKYSMIGYIGCQADKMNEAIIGMNDLLNTMPESEKLLQTCKASIKNTIETERYTEDAVINQYLADKRKGLDKDIRKDVYENFEKVNFAKLQQFAKENISGKPYTYCVVASDQKIKMDDLAKYGDVKKISLEEIFGY
ncbi:MAG: insulinase family protein [Bacteroidetes bacterium]|nr:insulinase family protein [Bacteroidota bacterium]